MESPQRILRLIEAASLVENPIQKRKREMRKLIAGAVSSITLACAGFMGCAVEAPPDEDEPIDEVQQALPPCGDGECSTHWGESSASCPEDCGPEAQPWCGDGTCNGNEWSGSCPCDCPLPQPWCGDGMCNGNETSRSCPCDCGGTCCGDGQCNGGETLNSCYEDCCDCYHCPC